MNGDEMDFVEVLAHLWWEQAAGFDATARQSIRCRCHSRPYFVDMTQRRAASDST